MTNDASGRASAPESMPMPDEFEPFLREAMERPAFRAAYEDADALTRTVDALIHQRHSCGLSQTEVARRMGVKQPTISGFETEGADPRFSTLQRYARAVGARIRTVVDVPSICDWVASPVNPTYHGGRKSLSSHVESAITSASWEAWTAPDQRPYRRHCA